MTQKQQNNVSIRLMSGGHAFSKQDIEAIRRAGAGVLIEVVTPKSVLRPSEGFVAADARLDLEAAGYTVACNKEVVYSSAVNGRVAVMAISRECLETIHSTGITPRFTSPLLEGEDMAVGTYISLYDDTLYVRVYGDRLLFAEVMEVKEDADILYYLESIHRVYNIYNMNTRATGDVERLRKVCKRYTKLKF